ncbi:MAG: myo-inositol-1(or 4)-monophosphatase [Paracoccaceae bacterium]
MPVNDDLALLIDAAQAAARIATPFWKSDHQVWQKADDAGPVTEADLAVDAMLRETLMAARPDYGWLSEETQDTPERLGRSRVFVVDPIDGTRAFTAGEHNWAHSLAIVENGTPIAGVVLLPIREKLYTAARDQGAFLNGQPIRASTRQQLEGADVLAARVTFEPQHWADAPPQVTRHIRSSLAYRLSLVAEGRFDAMLTLRDSWEWDIAAGCLLATEAGATVSDRFGATLRFNSPKALTKGTLCAAPGVHAETLLRLIQTA